LNQLFFIQKAWNEWKNKHNKKYENEDEHGLRYKIWSEAEEFIRKHNSEKHSFKIGHNKFSDLTSEEFSKKFKGFNAALQAKNHDSSKFKLSAVNIPESIDWRKQGYVNPVQDQGQCGCCYA
jgi:C1A family cysteine protease